MLAKFAMVSYIDCYENEDEQECNTTCLSSCNKWFERGYTTSGEYCIGKFSQTFAMVGHAFTELRDIV